MDPKIKYHRENLIGLSFATTEKCAAMLLIDLLLFDPCRVQVGGWRSNWWCCVNMALLVQACRWSLHQFVGQAYHRFWGCCCHNRIHPSAETSQRSPSFSFQMPDRATSNVHRFVTNVRRGANVYSRCYQWFLRGIYRSSLVHFHPMALT